MSMTLQSTYSTDPGANLPGALGSGPKQTAPGKNAEASVSIPFGTPVAFKPSAATTDFDVTLPANSSDQIRGIVYRNDSYSRAWTDSTGTTGDLDSTGLRVGVMMDVLTEGLVYVLCTTGCAPGDRLWVSYNTTGSTYTAKGQMGNADESGHAIDCTKQGQWQSTAAAGAYAWLKVDFLNKA